MVPYKPLSANVAPSPLLFSELRFRPIRSSPVPPSPVAQSFQLSPVPKVSPSPVARSMFRTPVPPSPSPPQLITSLEEEPFLTNNNFANNQATIIPDRAEVVVIRTSDLTSREKDKIFAMYNRTYRNAGYSQRFNTPAELFKKYPCIYAVKRYYTRAFVLVQHRIYYNKISGVCHNNTPLGKELMWFIIKTLLNQPNFYSCTQYYNPTIVNIDTFKVNWYDEYGNPLNNILEHCFTIRFYYYLKSNPNTNISTIAVPSWGNVGQVWTGS
jgi:hypothetical protein